MFYDHGKYLYNGSSIILLPFFIEKPVLQVTVCIQGIMFTEKKKYIKKVDFEHQKGYLKQKENTFKNKRI